MHRSRTSLLSVVLALVLALLAAGPVVNDARAEDEAADAAEAEAEAAPADEATDDDAAAGAGDDDTAAAEEKPAEKPKDKKKAVVDYRKLKELMPSTLAGLKRAEVEGERTAAGDFVVSTARATYAPRADAAAGDADEAADGEAAEGEADAAAAEDARSIELQIMDYGAMSDMAGAAAAWATLEIDQESDDGYTKTTKVDGHPAWEEYKNDGKSGSLQLFVAQRYIVTVNTTGLPVEDFQKIAAELPVDELAKLK